MTLPPAAAGVAQRGGRGRSVGSPEEEGGESEARQETGKEGGEEGGGGGGGRRGLSFANDVTDDVTQLTY